MSDLPAREAAEWRAFDLWESAGARAEATKFVLVGRSLIVLIRAYTNGDLLTREEAANDPEVIRMLIEKTTVEDGVMLVELDREVTDDD